MNSNAAAFRHVHLRRPIARLIALGLVATLAATFMPATASAQTPDYLVLAPSTATITADASQAYTAEGFILPATSIGDVTSSTTFSIVGAGTSCTGTSCTSTIPGTFTVTGTDGLATGTASLTVDPGAATHFSVTGISSPTTAGTAGSVTVTALDQFNNVATAYTGTVHLTSSDPAAVLGADSTLTSGVGSFAVTLKTAGTQSVTATDTLNNTITGAETGIVVDPAAATHLSVTGISSPTTAGAADSVTVTALDQFGNTDTAYTGTVHLTSSDPAAVLGADSTLTSGVGTFGVTFKTPGTQSVTATDTVSKTITGAETGIVVDPGAATHFTVTGLASPRTAGTAGSVTVTALDQFGNIATGYTGTVHLTSSDPAAVLGADATLTSGVGTFAVTLKTAGTQSVTATDTITSTITGSETGIVVNAAAATHFGVTGLTSPRTAGVAGSVTVTALDQFGNTDTTYSSTVHLTSSDPIAVLGASAALTSGVGTFAVTLETAGTQSVTASHGTITGSETGIVVTAAAATHFSVTGIVSPTTAGAAGSVTVTALDQFGNTDTAYAGTVHLTSSDPIAVLGADSTLTSGVGTFGVTLETAGTQLVTATDTLTNTITGAETGIVVDPAAATHLTVTGLTSPRTAGVAGNVTVTALDQFGNIATGYTGTVHLTSSDPAAVLGADSTLTSGVGTFAVTLKTAGTQSVTATDTITNTITGAETGIVVDPAAATHFSVTGISSPTTAGTAGSVTATALDPFNNVATAYTGTVHLTSSDPAAVLGADATLTSGVGTFAVTLKTAGTQSVTATDTVTNTITGAETGIVVDPAAATHLSVTGIASPTTAGAADSVTVTALDQFGNTATGYTGTVHLTSSDPAAVLGADSTLTSGVGTFPVTFKTPGTQSVTATDTVTNTITGAETGIVVNASAATHFTVTGLTSPRTAGVAGSVTVTALDKFNNIATGYTGTVHLTSSDPIAALGADSTLTSGVGTFGVTLKTAGSQSVTATDTIINTITGAETGIVVDPAAATHLTVTGLTSPRSAGAPGNVTVTALDRFNNIATGYTGTVHLTSSDPAAVLGADATLTSGVGTFAVTLKTAGTQSVTATDTVTNTITGAETGIVVNAAPATHFTVTGLASPRTAGVAGSVTVTALDQFGNTDTAYTGTVHLTSSDPAAVLGANSTLSSGVGTFAVTLKTAGTQSVTATDTIANTITGAETGIVVQAALGTYHALTPARLLDTRYGTGLPGGVPAKLVVNTPLSFQVTGRGGVPAGAAAVTGNLTVTGQSSLGYLFLGPVPTNNPTSSTLNFPLGDDRANGVTVGLSGTGTLSVTFVAPTGGQTTQAIFDVTGYFSPDATGATYHALTPARLLDTRNGTGGITGPIGEHSAQTFTVSGAGHVVPGGATAVTGNLTVTGQSSLGYLFLGPVPTDYPTSSTLNFPLGDDRANGVTVGLSGTGTLSFTFVAPTAGQTTQVIFDVTGYFTPDASGSGYHALTPSRLLDTRNGTGGIAGPIGEHSAQTFTVAGAGHVVPGGATAVTGNLTVTGQSSLGYLFIGPVPTNDPTSSTLNFPLGDDRADGVTVALSGTGTLSFTFVAPTAGQTTQVIFDVTGYFVPAT